MVSFIAHSLKWMTWSLAAKVVFQYFCTMSKTESFIALQEEYSITPMLVGKAADVIRDQDVSKYPVL